MANPGTFTLEGFPLSVLNRALEIYGVEEEDTLLAARTALLSAEGRKDVTGPYSPLAQAVAEYMSLTGPWGEDTGERLGESGYQLLLGYER